MGKCRKKQEAFRAEWGEETHETYEREKTKTVTTCQKWMSKGKYMTIGRMAWKEGGGKSGWVSACNLALHAVVLGPPWTKRDKKARNTKFLYFEESYEESLEEAWRVHEVWRDEVKTKAICDVADSGKKEKDEKAAGTGIVPAATTTTKNTSTTTTRKPEEKIGGVGKADDKIADVPKDADKERVAKKAKVADKGKVPAKANDADKAAALPKPKVPVEKTSLMVQLSVAKKLKTRHATSTVAAATLIRSAKSDVAWDWCRRSKGSAGLEASMEALSTTVAADSFCSAAVSRRGELSQLQKFFALDDAEFEVKLHKFYVDVSRQLERVEQEVTRLQTIADAEALLQENLAEAAIDEKKGNKKKKR